MCNGKSKCGSNREQNQTEEGAWFFTSSIPQEVTHSQQQPQGAKAHKKKSTIRLTYRINVLCPPKVSSLQVLGLD